MGSAQGKCLGEACVRSGRRSEVSYCDGHSVASLEARLQMRTLRSQSKQIQVGDMVAGGIGNQQRYVPLGLEPVQ